VSPWTGLTLQHSWCQSRRVPSRVLLTGRAPDVP